MAINTTAEYIDFFINLNMGEKVSLLSFVNNERMVLKQKLENKINKKEYLTYLDKVKKDYNVSVLRINGVLAKNRGINSLVNKSTSFGLKMAEALNIKAKSYETNKEFANAIGKTESEASNIGGAYINGKIYFNKW